MLASHPSIAAGFVFLFTCFRHISQLLLNELGFDEGFTNPLRVSYLNPVSKLLFPDCVREGLDSQRAFVVNYCADEDKKKDIGLSSHYDNAEVTLNVSLGKDFTDGELYFMDKEVAETVG